MARFAASRSGTGESAALFFRSRSFASTSFSEVGARDETDAPSDTSERGDAFADSLSLASVRSRFRRTVSLSTRVAYCSPSNTSPLKPGLGPRFDSPAKEKARAPGEGLPSPAAAARRARAASASASARSSSPSGSAAAAASRSSFTSAIGLSLFAEDPEEGRETGLTFSPPFSVFFDSSPSATETGTCDLSLSRSTSALSSRRSSRSASITRWYSAMCVSTVPRFSCTNVLISFALSAYFRVFTVCSYCALEPLTVATITVRELPHKPSFRMRVNLESRNGTNTNPFF